MDDARIQCPNEVPVNADGKFVLYWMQQSQQAANNAALEYAIGRANEIDVPTVAVFKIDAGYPAANRRHFAFML